MKLMVNYEMSAVEQTLLVFRSSSPDTAEEREIRREVSNKPIESLVYRNTSMSNLHCYGVSRMVEVEKKIDGIFSILQSKQAPSEAPTLPTPESSTSQYASPGNQLPFDQTVSATEEGLANPIAAQSTWISSEQIDDVISKGYLPFHEAEMFLEDFKMNYQRSFPCIVIPSDLSLDRFRLTRPYLLLSVLAVASKKQPVLQQILQQEFRTILSNKVINEGSQDIDLLQGSIVFLAWCVS